MKIATLPIGTTGASAAKPAATAPSDLQSTFAGTLGDKIAASTSSQTNRTDKPAADTTKKKVESSQKQDETSVRLPVSQSPVIAVSQPPVLQLNPEALGSGTTKAGTAPAGSIAEANPLSNRDQASNVAALVSGISADQGAQFPVPAASEGETDATTIAKLNKQPSAGDIATVEAAALPLPALTSVPPAISNPSALATPVASTSQSTAVHDALQLKPTTPTGGKSIGDAQAISTPQHDATSAPNTTTTATTTNKVSNDTDVKSLSQGLAFGRSTEPRQTEQPKPQSVSEHSVTTTQSDLAVAASQPTSAIQTAPPSATVTVPDSSANTDGGTRSSAAVALDSAPASSSQVEGSNVLNQTGRVNKGKNFASELRGAKDDAVDDSNGAASDLKVAVVAPHVGAVSAGSNVPHSASGPNAVNIGAAQPISDSGNALAANASQTTQPQAGNNATPPSASTAPQHVATQQTDSASALSNAQMIQSAHGSEMRLGIKSAEFGDISINTSLNRQALSAQISMEHTALGHALAAHLPAIEEKLSNAYGVEAKVMLRDNSSASSSNDSSGAQKQDRQSPGYAAAAQASAAVGVINAPISSPYTSSAATTSRLDIRI